jgi:inorganic pyrophosphatase
MTEEGLPIDEALWAFCYSSLMSAPTDSLEVVVEIPRGSRNKYELDETTGAIRLDRVLFSSVHYPTDYGYIPSTLAEDGDHLDVLVVVEEPTFPGCRVEVRPLGVLVMRDEQGTDEKIVAVPVADPRFEGIRDLSHLAPHWLREIENFFDTYKALEDKETEVTGWDGREAAWDCIHKAQERYGKKQ